MRAAITMGANVNDKRAIGRLHLIGAKQKQQIEGTERRHLRGVQPARTTGKADMEGADARGRIMQHGETVPVIFQRARIHREPCREREDPRPVMPPDRATADQHDRLFGTPEHIGKGMLTRGQIAQRVRTRTEIIVAVGQVGLGANHTNLQLAAPPALADARVENGCLLARVRANDKKRVRLFNPRDAWIKYVGGATGLWLKRVAALHRQVDRAVLRQQILQCKHLLDRGEIARDSSNPFAVGKSGLCGNSGERFAPCRGAQRAVLPDVGAVEPLGAQTVDNMAGLVGDPFIVHRLVDAGENPHDLAAARIDPDRRTDAVHHIDRLRLAKFPWPRRERIRL